MSNLELWESLETTDTQYTRKMTTGAKLTSIDPMYQIKKFTDKFGQCGKGWGFTVTYSELIEGARMMSDAHRDGDGHPIDFGPSKVHTARIELWYLDGSERCTIEGTGHTPYLTLTKNGPTTDMEYEKKSITDALTKAMSMLGMSADVRMGQFDNPDYVAGLQLEEAIEGSVEDEAAKIKQRQDYDDWYTKTLELCRTAVSMHELEVVYTSSMLRVKGQGTADQVTEFTNAKNERGRELVKAQREQQQEVPA